MRRYPRGYGCACTPALVDRSNSIGPSGYDKYLRETEVARTEPIRVRRLDAVYDEVVPASARRVFLKSDTQGYDPSRTIR